LSSSNLIGTGTDDAVFLLGTEHGLIKNVRSNLSHVIGVHCVAHRLNVSVLSAVKNGKFIDDIDSTLKKLYKFYHEFSKEIATEEGSSCEPANQYTEISVFT
jgi:hypothetical protein